MKKIITLLLVVVLIFSFSACNESSSPTSSDSNTNIEKDYNIPDNITLRDSDVLKGKKIGCNIVYKDDEWCSITSKAIETLSKYYDCECVCEDSNLDIKTNAEQLENMISNNCDFILSDPVDSNELTEIYNKAIDKKIPVFIYDRLWSEKEKAVSNIQWDNYTSGVIAANYFLDYVRKNMPEKKCKVVEMIVQSAPHTLERFTGFHDTLEKASDVDIEIIEKFDSESKKEVAEKALSSVKESYDFVISDVNNGALGALDFLRSSGNKDVKIISMGAYGSEAFTLLHDNDPNYLACVNIDPWVLANTMFNSVIDYYEGNTPDNIINIDQFIVDSSNVEEFWDFE